MKFKLALVLLAALAPAVMADSPLALPSPDGKIVVRFDVHDDGTPIYRVDYLEKPIILESPLGFAGEFTNGFKMGASHETHHVGTWTNEFGELRLVPDNYNGLTVELAHRSGLALQMTFRAYNEGVAFRYALTPRQTASEFKFAGEHTEFRLPAGTFGYEEHGTEGEYRRALIAEIRPECERPLTLEYTNGIFAALGEADNENYPRMLLSGLDGDPGSLVSVLGGASSNTADKRVGGNPVAVMHPGEATPWRVVLIGRKPGDLLEHNYLILNLNPPLALSDPSWIRPGKVMRDTTLTTTNAKAIIDFAAEGGLQYVGLDDHWYGQDESPATGDATTARARNLDVPEIIRYGKEKNIGLILYVDRRQAKKQRDTIFPLYEKWGVKGVKIGFVDVGPQTETAWITETIHQAAEHHLMLDIHDGYRPTGYIRTYPNLLTVEGVRGNEHMPTSEHNCTLPFTRYLAGPADYTVCYYDKRKQTTFAHQLAMAVVSFSPMQFIYWYDKPTDSQGEPELEFFRKVPTVWDETKVLDGEIGRFAVIARRSGQDWFVGAINNHDVRALKVPLAFLTAGGHYTAHIYSDGSDVATRTHVACATLPVDAGSVLDVSLHANGGEAIWINSTSGN